MTNKMRSLIKQRIWRLHLQAFLSRYIGYVVIFVASITYITDLWKQSIKAVFPMGLSGLAIIVALSALAFTMVPCLTESKDKSTILYAGEKFFQSSIFLIEAIFLKYAGEAIKGAKMLQSMPTIATVTGGVIDIMSTLCILWATFVFLYGYNELNNFLWERYLERINGDEKATTKQERTKADA